MRVVIATFEAPGRAAAFRAALDGDFGVAAQVSRDARIGAQGEPYDGHRLVVAWVPCERAEEVRARAEGLGGVLHEPPASIAPPHGVAPPPASPEASGTLGERTH